MLMNNAKSLYSVHKFYVFFFNLKTQKVQISSFIYHDILTFLFITDFRTLLSVIFTFFYTFLPILLVLKRMRSTAVITAFQLAFTKSQAFTLGSALLCFYPAFSQTSNNLGFVNHIFLKTTFCWAFQFFFCTVSAAFNRFLLCWSRRTIEQKTCYGHPKHRSANSHFCSLMLR